MRSKLYRIILMGILAGLLHLGLGDIDLAEASVKLSQTYLTSKEAMLLPYIVSAANKYKIEPQLIMAHIYTESSYLPTSKKWEYREEYSWGAMQLLRKTAESLAGRKLTDSELLDPYTNIDLGAKYIKQNLDRYGGNYNDAIAAYNAGSAMKNEKGQYVNTKGVPNVQKYVDKVVKALSTYREAKTPMKYSIAAALPEVIAQPIVEVLPQTVAENFTLWALGGIALGAVFVVASNKT